jgi:hypothetical protein
MRLNIVYDDKGTIAATSEVVPGGDVVLPGPGEHAAEMEVPDEFAETVPDELIERARVDVEAGRLIERRD